MKKVSIFAVALVGVFAMSSCKKEYTCTCTTADGTVVVNQTIEDKKADAEDSCDAAGAAFSGAGITCNLD